LHFRENTVAENRLSAILDDMAKKPVQRRAYSYIRFSSAEQEKGDSLRRQAKLRDEVLKCHPEWILDESLIEDFGVSAWEGDNIIDGALGTFILACEAGKVPAYSHGCRTPILIPVGRRPNFCRTPFRFISDSVPG
jgi:hypothetical protein